MIEFKNVSKSYDLGKTRVNALKNVSMSIPKGSIFGIVGGSGAGKSSLLRCVNLLERPDEGQVSIDKIDITGLSDSELRQTRRQMGMIFQHFNLLSRKTVFENAAIGLLLQGLSKEKVAKKINELLELTGIAHLAEFYPHQLSGGQCQRVGVARALATDPSILLCDEATSALDPQTTEQILSLLKDINRRLGITIVLITHELDVVKAICDRVALLEHGSLVEQSASLDFFARPKSAQAKKFVASEQRLVLPQNLADKIKAEQSAAQPFPVVKLSFVGQETTHPVLSAALRQFDLDINFLMSNIEVIGESTFGAIIIELRASSQQLELCLSFFNQKNLYVEFLGYVA